MKNVIVERRLDDMKLNDVEIEIEASNKEALDFFRHEFVMIRSIQTDKQRKIKCAEKC